MRKWVRALIILALVGAMAIALFRRRPDPPSLPRELSHFGLACLLYAQDHGGSMPPDIKTLPAAGMLNRDVARDLAARIEYRCPKEKASSIPAEVIIAYEAKANSSGYRSVLFMNGNVVALRESQFAGFQPARDGLVIVTPSGALGTEKIPGN